MFTITVSLHIPQLDTLGKKIMAGMQDISQALDTLSSTLDTELGQIADALSATNGPTQEVVNAVVQRVNDLRDRIANIIPDMPAPM